MADFPVETGRAVVTTTFLLHGRGRVFVLGGHEGVLPRNGMVSDGTRWLAYSGPEFIDGPGKQSNLAVIVAEQDVSGFDLAANLTFVDARPNAKAAAP